MGKTDLDTFLDDEHIEIEASYMDYRIFKDKSTGRLGVLNFKTSELQYGAVFDKVIDVPSGGHFFLRHVDSHDFYVLTKYNGAVIIPEAKELESVRHLGRDHYEFSKGGLWGIVNAETGTCINKAEYDQINHFGSELHVLIIDNKRTGFFDDKTGQLYAPKEA